MLFHFTQNSILREFLALIGGVVWSQQINKSEIGDNVPKHFKIEPSCERQTWAKKKNQNNF